MDTQQDKAAVKSSLANAGLAKKEKRKFTAEDWARELPWIEAYFSAKFKYRNHK